MLDVSNADLAKIFTSKSVARLNGTGETSLNFRVIDADPSAYVPVFDELQRIMGLIGPDANFLMTYEGRRSFTAPVAARLGIGHGEAVKVWVKPPDSPSEDITSLKVKLLTAIMNKEDLSDFKLTARLDQEILFTRGDLDIVVIDHYVETGEATVVLAKALREFGFKVNNAIFLTEIRGGEGREALLREGIETYSMTTYSPKIGFGKGIIPNDAASVEAGTHVRMAAGFASPKGEDPASGQRYRMKPFRPQLPYLLSSGPTTHNQRRLVF